MAPQYQHLPVFEGIRTYLALGGVNRTTRDLLFDLKLEEFRLVRGMRIWRAPYITVNGLADLAALVRSSPAKKAVKDGLGPKKDDEREQELQQIIFGDDWQHFTLFLDEKTGLVGAVPVPYVVGKLEALSAGSTAIYAQLCEYHYTKVALKKKKRNIVAIEDSMARLKELLEKAAEVKEALEGVVAAAGTGLRLAGAITKGTRADEPDAGPEKKKRRKGPEK